MGQIRKRGNTWQIDYFDPNGKRVRQSFKKKKDAEAELGKRVSLIAEGRYLDVKRDYKSTMGELLTKYEENYKHQASWEKYKKFCLDSFRTYFGENTRLSNIRYMDLETFRNQLRVRPTKDGGARMCATVNREMACLHHIFAKAVEWEMIECSPFDKGRTLIAKENNKRTRYLTDDEVERLITECAKKPHLYRIVMCALNTGMRRGEILTLRWDQIRNGFIYLQKTKTNEAREIPVNDTLANLFKQIRAEQGLTSKCVFTYQAGKKSPVSTIQRVDRAFKAALKNAGITNFKFHDLRHTFASHLMMRGASLQDVQEILGHKTMTMTLRYAHLSQEHKKKAVNLLNGLTASAPTVTKLSQPTNSTKTATS